MSGEDRKRLEGCHPDLIRKVGGIIADLKGHGYNVAVVEGVRTRARQLALWRKGRVPRWNKKLQVTWTLNSRHFRQRDGYGHAADLAFIDKGKFSWDAALPWYLIGRSAEAHGLKWGVIFKDGRRGDLGHVELKG